MRDGVVVVGEFLGVSSEPWNRNGKSGVNHRMGIGRKYIDRYGQTLLDTINVDLSQEFLAKLNADQLKGKRVAVDVLARGKPGGPSGAWLSLFATRDAEIVVLDGKGK